MFKLLIVHIPANTLAKIGDDTRNPRNNKGLYSGVNNFISLLNEEKLGKPFEIDAGGVFGDAEMLLKALGKSQLFDRMLASKDKAVNTAALALASGE